MIIFCLFSSSNFIDFISCFGFLRDGLGMLSIHMLSSSFSESSRMMSWTLETGFLLNFISSTSTSSYLSTKEKS